MAVNTTLALQYPVGSSPEQLRSAVVRLVDVLRNIQTDASQQAAIEQLQAETTALNAGLSGVAGDITDLETADSALNGAVDNVLGLIGLVESDVAALQSNQLTPQERFEIALDHVIDTVQGSRAEWQAEFETQLRYMADAILQTSKLQQDDSAAIVTTQIVQETDRATLAQQINAVVADLAETDAAVVNVQIAYAAGDAALESDISGALSQISALNADVLGLDGTVSAIAADLSTVETTANGNTTAINSLSLSVDGISAQWGVSISTNGNIIGAATLSGSENVSSFNVVVNKFQFALTDNGTPQPFFTAGLVNGVATSVFTGTLIGDGTIVARNILAGAVTTAKLAAGAVTADKVSLTSLSELNPNAGVIVNGVLRDAASVYELDIANGKFWKKDGTFIVDAKNGYILA